MLSQSIVNITLENGDKIADITLSCSSAVTLPERCTLHFTSLVDVSRVPNGSAIIYCAIPLAVKASNHGGRRQDRNRR
ncbi:hypothetical protein KC356_g238 [Hortaea werneckii]|nr:hypothetical protein KC356_g238 [Hortaea werneckii]